MNEFHAFPFNCAQSEPFGIFPQAQRESLSLFTISRHDLLNPWHFHFPAIIVIISEKKKKNEQAMGDGDEAVCGNMKKIEKVQFKKNG